MSDGLLPVDLQHVKQKLLDAVADEHVVLHGYLDHMAGQTQIDWSVGTRELWKLWQRELRGFKAPPPEPTPTGFDEARVALALFQRAVENLPDSTPSKPPPDRKTPRLTVNIERRTVTLDGQPFDVKSAQAVRWVKVLCDHPGNWIASADLKRFDPDLDGARPDRLKKFLPEPVQSLIDSETGKGSRLRLA